MRINSDTPNLIGVTVNATAHLTATVNSSDTGVTWQVNGITGGNSTVGTISTGGLFTAPAQVPDPDTVTVTAVAHVDSTASASIQIQIWPALQVTISISPQDKSVPVGTTLQYTADVENTDDKAIQWQVNGIEGGNSTVGTISTAGLFTAPSAVPSPAKETITAVSHADSTKSASTSVTIVAFHNNLLNGRYAFELSGPDASGKMTAAIGSFTADGNGNLQGLIDINSVASPAAQTSVPFTGTYGIGAQNLGFMFLNLTPQLTLSFAVNDSGDDAKLVEYDTRGTRYAGSLQRQDTNLSLEQFVGYYVFSCYGTTMSGERMTAIGRFQSLGSGGTISDVSIDAKEQGSTMEQRANLTGTVSMKNNTYGQGQFAFAQSGAAAAHFSYYMVNGNELYFLSIDPVPSDNPLLIGHIYKQTGSSFSYGSLNGKSVLSLAGIVPADPSKSVVLAGTWQVIPGSSGVYFSYDINEGGTIYTNQDFGTSFAVDVTGQGYIVEYLFQYKQLYFYMIDANRAVLMQSVGDQGLIGVLEPQTATTFDNSLLNGTYRIGPISMPRPDAGISQGMLVADGAGTFWAGENILDQGLSTQTMNGNYIIDSTGRTQLTVTDPETFHYIAYPVSGSRFVGISIEPSDSKPNVVSLDQ